MRIFDRFRGTDRLTRRTLKWVNLTRRETGLAPLTDLPKGTPGEIRTCPIAVALTPPDGRAQVGVFSFDVWRSGVTITTGDLPPAPRRWVHKFDRYEYPEYRS